MEAVARRRRRIHLRDAFVIGLLGGVALFPELGGAGELGLGKIEIGVGLGKIGLGRFERELERLRLDDEEQIALLDVLAVDEIDGFEIAADARPHVHEIDRLELPGEVLQFDELPDQGLSHGDLGRRGRCCRLLCALEERQLLPEPPIIVEQCRETRGQQQEKDAAKTSARRGRRLRLAWRWGGHGLLVRSLLERGHVFACLGRLAAAWAAIVIPLRVHGSNLMPKSGGVSVPASSKESQDIRTTA